MKDIKKEFREFVDEKHYSTRVDPRLITEEDAEQFLLAKCEEARKEERREIQQDLNCVITMLNGGCQRFKVVNYIKKYLLEEQS